MSRRSRKYNKEKISHERLECSNLGTEQKTMGDQVTRGAKPARNKDGRQQDAGEKDWK